MNFDDGFSGRAEPIFAQRPSTHPRRWWRAVFVLLGGLAASGSNVILRAQDPAEAEEQPLVRKVILNGVQHADEDDLREGLASQPTRCKGLLLRPICWITESGIFTDKHRLDRAEVERDELRLRVMYWRLGYRYAEVASSIIERDDGVDVRFDITEGSPVIAQTVVVEQTQQLLTERQIRQAGMLKPGTPVNTIVLDSAQARLNVRLWDLGYGDALVRDTVILIDSLNADVRVLVDPQWRTTVGTIGVSGNESVTERTVRRLVDLRTGQLYRRRDVLDAQRRLYRSELFKQALINVPEGTDSVKDIAVTVREAPPDALRFGAGYNTIEYVQTEGEYTRYNWIGTARRLELRAAMGNLMARQLGPDDTERRYQDPTWRLSASVTQPWLVSTRNSIGLSVFAHRRSVRDVVVDRGHGASASFTRQLAESMPASLTYRFERTVVEGGDLYFCVNFGVCELRTITALRQTHKLSPLLMTAFADRADDALAPTRGWTARLELEHASAFTLSDYRYNRAGAETARYFRIGRGTLAAHVRGGWIRSSASTAQAVNVPDSAAALVHPNRRYYAGGARSVRGFAENQLGPRVLTIDPRRLIEPEDSSKGVCTVATVEDGSCDPNIASSRFFVPRPVGGSTLLEGSIEYRWPITESLISAVFIDAGRLGALSGQSLTTARTAFTPGVGIRYRSPIGPIRIDLAMRPTAHESLPVVTQIGDANSLRLVHLQTRKDYDPLETTGGGLRKLLARFQLHLAIGEAY